MKVELSTLDAGRTIHSGCSCHITKRIAPGMLMRTLAHVQDGGMSIEDLLAEANALLEKATTKPRSSSVLKSMEEVAEVQQVEYICDESGCVVVFPGMDAADASLANVLSISGENFQLEANR
jgi:hypothetical protein